MLDSGGFSELTLCGKWSISPGEYVAEVRRYREEIGRLRWVTPMDWMCEPSMIQRTGLSIAEHQRRTVRNYQELQGAAPELPWIPVLQGWQIADYHSHEGDYAAAGIDLQSLPLVGLGSVCRRQHTGQVERIIRSLHPLRLHAFGVKTTGLLNAADALVSSDSMAWSRAARYDPPLDGCSHRNCANCIRYAKQWRNELLERLSEPGQRPRQHLLGF